MFARIAPTTQANRDTAANDRQRLPTSTRSRRNHEPVADDERTRAEGAASWNLAHIPVTARRVPLEGHFTVGKPEDPLEREADHIAESVLRMPALELPGRLPTMAGSRQRRAIVKAGEAEKGAGPLHRKAAQHNVLDGSIRSPLVGAVLRESGEPLDAAARAFFEPRFGHDFSAVRVHRGERAATSARAINALGYTAGNHIVFGAGRYDVNSQGGRRLLAHELAHTVQQSPPHVVCRRSFIDKALVFLGLSEGEFSDGELTAYLIGVDTFGKIENHYA
jgi:hypothetical protein